MKHSKKVKLSFGEAFAKWAGEKKFYIVLFCSIMIIGSAYWFTVSYQSAKAPASVPKTGVPYASSIPDPATPLPDLTKTMTGSGTKAAATSKPAQPVAQATSKPKSVPASAVTEASSAPEVKSAQTRKKLVYPVNGVIITEFSGESLVYSKTLDDWRTHEGIDIKAEIGTMVKAGGDGKVQDVYTDDAMGITIIIDHQNGLKSVYANLSTDTMVRKGQDVKTGDVISGVGDSALYETGEVGHLHFEVVLDGEKVNPKDWLTA